MVISLDKLLENDLTFGPPQSGTTSLFGLAKNIKSKAQTKSGNKPGSKDEASQDGDKRNYPRK